jgi:hypothetical protein
MKLRSHSRLFNRKASEVEAVETDMGRKKLEQFMHYSNMEELKASANKGCHFCTHLWCVAEYERLKGGQNPSKENIAASNGMSVGIVLQISMSVEGTGRYKDIGVNVEVDGEVGHRSR